MSLPKIPFGLPTLLPPPCLLQTPIHPLRPHSISPAPKLLQAKYLPLCPAPPVTTPSLGYSSKHYVSTDVHIYLSDYSQGMSLILGPLSGPDADGCCLPRGKDG